MTEPSSESLANAVDDAAGAAKFEARTTHIEHLGDRMTAATEERGAMTTGITAEMLAGDRITAMRKRRPRLIDEVVTLAHGAGGNSSAPPGGPLPRIC
jgi:hypothetical protein